MLFQSFVNHSNGFFISLFILGAVFLGFAYQYHNKPSEFATNTESPVSQQFVEPPARTEIPAPIPAREPAESAPVAPAQNMQNQLAEERAALLERADEVAALRTQKTLRTEQITTEIPNRIENSARQIENYSEALEMRKTEEQRLDSLVQAEINTQQNLAQATQQQIEPLVRDLENRVLQIQDQINNLNSATYITPIDKEPRLAAMNMNLQQLTAQLKQLQNQNIAVSAELVARSQALNTLVNNEKVTFAENQTAIQDYIYSLRDEIARLQDYNQDARTAITTLDSQLAAAEKNYIEQQQKVKKLESRIE